jgi:hypothetical protein
VEMLPEEASGTVQQASALRREINYSAVGV